MTELEALRIRAKNSKAPDHLDDEDLETILIIARNGQSGRITEREIRLLVAAYRKDAERRKRKREGIRKMMATKAAKRAAKQKEG
jgi:hypothetical protein